MSRKCIIAVIVVMTLVFVLGCTLTSQLSAAEQVPAEPVEEAAPPPTDVPMEEPTVPPPPPTAESVPEPEVEVEPEIVHVMMPAQGNGEEQKIADQISQETAPEKRAYAGDVYTKGRYERPFTAQEMEYLPFLDLVNTALIRDIEGGWLYTSIRVVEPPSMSGERKAIYGIEVDNDLDGRGDVLILADAPESNEWTTDGVRVWRDVNANIGAKDPMKPNAPLSDDGYEMMIFDEGKGEDADLAWVRLSAERNNEIEIAFKLDLVDIGEEYYFFLWGAWAFADDAHPEWFDHHDHFTLEEAGSPLKDDANYPLKAFFAADNTCRALSGLAATSQLLGMCPVAAPQASGGDDEERCPPENCCPLATVGCNSHWDFSSCSCVPNN